MNEEFLASLTFRNVVQSVYRQRRLAMGFVVGMVILVFVALLLIPKKYLSEGKMFVTLGRGGITLDPTATTGQTIMVQESRESEINSIVDILTSRGLLEEVLRRENTLPDRVLESKSVSGRLASWSPSNWFAGDSAADPETIDLAVRKLQDCISVYVPRKAATISVWCKTESPEFSKAIVDNLMEVYLQEHVKARQTEGSFDFFETQFFEQKEQLQQASRELSQFKNRIGVMSITDRRGALRDKISTIEKRLIEAGSTLAAAQSRLAKSRGLVKDMPARLLLEETEGVAQHSSDLMRDRLYNLELQEKQLLARYTPRHPQVVAVRAQVQAAKEIMNSQAPDRKVTKKGINKNVQEFELHIMNSEVETSAVSAEKNILEEKLQLAEREMHSLNQDEIRLAELTRALEVADRNFRIYAEKMEEARINLELDRKQISNVKIVQPGSLQLKHVSPRKSLILLVTLFSSTVAAIGIAVFVDRLGGTLNAPEDIVEVLQLDLLASVPVIQTEQKQLLLSHEDLTHDSIGT